MPWHTWSTSFHLNFQFQIWLWLCDVRWALYLIYRWAGCHKQPNAHIHILLFVCPKKREEKIDFQSKNEKKAKLGKEWKNLQLSKNSNWKKKKLEWETKWRKQKKKKRKYKNKRKFHENIYGGAQILETWTVFNQTTTNDWGLNGYDMIKIDFEINIHITAAFTNVWKQVKQLVRAHTHTQNASVPKRTFTLERKHKTTNTKFDIRHR